MTYGARLAAPSLLALGCALLLLRPHGTLALLVTFGVVAACGALARPVARERLRRSGLPLALGLAAVLAGRVAGGGRAALPATAFVVASNTLAAVAEELLFRRLAYGVLLRWGTAVAVTGSAALFAVVHVTTYGLWVLPLDLLAGLLLSWQRAASGTWTVPALTHSVANLLAVL